MYRSGWQLLVFLLSLVVLGVSIIVGDIRKSRDLKTAKKNMNKKMDEIYIDNFSGFVDRESFFYKLNSNKFINNIGKINNESRGKWEKLFNDSKNPWGMTPTVFRAIRVTLTIVFLILSIISFFLFEGNMIAFFFVILTGLSWFYPTYYYKAIAKEREQEWDKMYEFIWLIKYGLMMYDAKKVFIETRKYIESNYPQYEEIITGLSDFGLYWNEKEIPEYIKKYYNFSIPKELYTIIFNMVNSGHFPEDNLNSLKEYAINKHNGLIQSVLSNVASKATVFSLPFLMLSVVVALLIPMITTFIELM